jgi:hypothetical protein
MKSYGNSLLHFFYKPQDLYRRGHPALPYRVKEQEYGSPRRPAIQQAESRKQKAERPIRFGLPSSGYRRLTAFCLLLSAFCFLPSAFCLLLSAFCLLLLSHNFTPRKV